MSDEEKAPRPRHGAAFYAFVVAAIALVSSAIGLVFDVSPGLRPDPREKLGAAVSVLAAEPGVPLGEWLDRGTESEGELKRKREQTLRNFRVPRTAPPEEVDAQLRIQGTAFFVQTLVEGLKRDDVELRWTLYDHGTKRRFEPTEDEWHDQPTVQLRQSTPTDRAVVLAWIPDNGSPDRVFARFEIRDEDGATLAMADSRPFVAKGR